MTYSQSIGHDARMVTRTVRGSFDFSGRSRRTEVLYYWIASALASALLGSILGLTASFEMTRLLTKLFQIALMVPLFALFVRRLHDQGKSGWWRWLLPLASVLSIPKWVAELHGDITEIVAKQTTPTNWVAALCGLCVFALCLVPGTDGENAYGTDPRLEER